MDKKELKRVFTPELIENLKNNKDLITFELLEQLRSMGNTGKQIALDILDTEKSSDGFYLDAHGNPISFDGNRRLKKAFTEMSLSKIHIDEIKRCASDLNYFMDNYVKIRTKNGVNFPELRKYQKEFLEVINKDENESIASLQPRQAGKSITLAIYMTWLFVFDHDKGMGICANRGTMAREFLNNISTIFSDLPMWLRPGLTEWNKGTIETENKMRVLTSAPSKDAFRGFTIHLIVVDETAFIRASLYKEFIDSVMPSLSGLGWKKMIYISTANGLNHFYELVKGAKERKVIVCKTQDEVNNIEDKILEVKNNIDGTISVTVDKPSNGTVFYGVDWHDVPRYNAHNELMSPEEFRDKIVAQFGEVYFAQNYACSFVGSSYTLLNDDTLRGLTPSDPVEKWDNRLLIYREPMENHRYIMAVDPAKGGLDAFAVNVIDVSSMPFEQVGTARLFKCNYQIMPEFLNEWGNRFNNAFIIVENNEGAGTFVANMLKLDFGYENLYIDKSHRKEPGFRTTSKTRNQILETLKFIMDCKKLILHDKDTISELFTFIIVDNKYQADDGCHDDMVMSLALSFAPFTNVRNFDEMSKLVKILYSDCMDHNRYAVMDFLAIGNFDILDDTTEMEGKAGKKFDDEFIYSFEFNSPVYQDNPFRERPYGGSRFEFGDDFTGF